ncbi:MAG: hypothetical protein JWP89_6721 [Schlesneria sp.]|nr:hypothetical protein [Schlesneria sp.]
MDASHSESAIAPPPTRRTWLWIVGVISQLTLICVLGLTVPPYCREQRITSSLETYGGKVEFADRGPSWIPEFVRKAIPLGYRIQAVRLSGREINADLITLLRSLPNLERLYLDHTRVTDAELGQLSGLIHLEWLALNDTPISDSGLTHLVGLTQLQLLTLDNTSITDAGLGHFRGLKNLERLGLAQTRVSNNGMHRLQQLTRLKRLDLSDTEITDDGLIPLVDLKEMAILDLSRTGVTNHGLETLVLLTNLKSLNLEETEVTAEGKAVFRTELLGCEVQ